MKEKLIARLKDLGYDYYEGQDGGMLEFTIQAVEERIRNATNQTTIPDDLEYVEIDMICGEFLRMKKACGQLETYVFEQAVQSIKEGDTQVSFGASASPEAQFDALLHAMVNGHDEDLLRHRRLVW